ncbi:unnamed protein product [Cylindrotheca closterium]|uniref:Uncharacterized protein n=1 Tax=Cylindrotheca closterium TaxID=2856 RepID=A0AAD2JHR5_9STRA|nr:unnamed protein product [Cylindrotheca closterium]
MVKIMRRLSLTGGTKEPARSKAVDDLLDRDLALDLEMNSSVRSFASSITTPASQSGSFYHRVQHQNEISEKERTYGYEENGLTGDMPADWVSESSDEDAESTNSWGGFSNKNSATDTNSVGSGDEKDSVKSSPVMTRKSIKSRNDSKKKNKQKKKKKRLKDFFRKSGVKNEPITEVDEGDLVTESEGKEGSMALLPLSDHGGPRKGSRDSEIDSQSEQHSIAQSLNSKQSSKSGRSRGSRKGNNRKLSPGSRASNSPKNSPKTSKARKKKNGLNSSTHNSVKTGNSAKPKQARRGSFGALTRRMSLGGKSDDGDVQYGESQDGGQSRTIRRGSLGGGTEPGNTYGGDSENPHRMARRRSSLGSMLESVVRRGSLGGGNDTNGDKKQKGPVIPEDYHNIIHRERVARGMYLLQRNIILDTLAQGIANDLAAGRAPTPCEFYGNIGKGTSLSVIHSKIMEERKGVSRKNILSERFTCFGMGLAIGGEKNESIFMCTLFQE